MSHFCIIHGSRLVSDDEKIANALATIKQYDVVGLYQDMPQFLAEVAVLLGLPVPRQVMTPVNVTTGRPDVSRISTALRARIIEMNELDIRLFNGVLAWKAAASFQMPANLDVDSYFIGLSFIEELQDGKMDLLARRDELYGFSIIDVSQRYWGYFYLPTEITLCPSTTKYVFQGDGSRLGTVVGSREGGIVASGQAGFLIYGPYLTLVPGSYQVFIHCAVGKGGLMEIVTGRGKQVIAKGDFEEPDGTGCFEYQYCWTPPVSTLRSGYGALKSPIYSFQGLKLRFVRVSRRL